MATPPTSTPVGYRRMHHDELDLDRWDRPACGTPPRRVVICSTPRSGSYLLCRQMINAGLGLPTEYFRERTIRTLHARWDVNAEGDDAYIDALEAHRTTPNGVFGTKLQWQQHEQHPATGERWLERADLIVFLYRSDLVAQAVSWQVSLATGIWSFDATRGPTAKGVTLEPSDLALRLASRLHQQNLAWQALITRLGRPSLVVPYEAFTRAQGALLQDIATRLGLAASEWTLPPPEGPDNRRKLP